MKVLVLMFDALRNYTCAAVGIIMLVAAITWVTTGRHHFTGPPGSTVIEGTVAQADFENSEIAQEKHNKTME